MAAMDIMTKKIREMAKKTRRRLVLPEGDDARTLKAAAVLSKEGLADVVLLGAEARVREAAGKAGADISLCRVVDPDRDADRDRFVERYFELRKHTGLSKDEAAKLVSDPLYYGTLMLDADKVDGFLSGANHATSDTLRPALQVIKPSPKARAISSFFIMVVPDCAYGENGIMLMGDCAIVPDPSAAKLALMAIATARMARILCGFEPRVAVLSFSTKGSAEHESVDKVREAVRIAKEKAPDLLIDGEMQADAALVPEIGERKAPGSKVAGHANVLIFPDLQSANIGYKLVQRLAKAEAIGPILQGFNKPVNDLSRGASVDDIITMGAATMMQADPSLR